MSIYLPQHEKGEDEEEETVFNVIALLQHHFGTRPRKPEKSPSSSSIFNEARDEEEVEEET